MIRFDNDLGLYFVSNIENLVTTLKEWFSLDTLYLRNFLANVVVLKLESKREARTSSVLGSKWNMAIEQLNNLARDHETKTNSIHIHLKIVLDKAEELKKLVLISLRDPYSSVWDRNFQKLFIGLSRLNYLNRCSDLSRLCKFDCIRLEIDENLHDPILITAKVCTFSNYRGLLIVWNSYKLNSKVNILISSFLTLHLHDFIYRFFDVENGKVFSKVARLDLGEVKHVLNYEFHKLSWIVLHLSALIKLLHYLQASSNILVLL